MKFFTKEVKIALVAITGIVVLFFGMNFLKGLSLFSSDKAYFIRFKNINGLSASNPIFVNGYQVGVVKGIQYDFHRNTDIIVKFEVSENLSIPQGSSAEIESDFMGNVKMNLILADNYEKLLNVGDTIAGHLSNGIMAKAAELVPTVEKMLPKLDSILTNVNLLMADPAIAQSLHNIRNTTANLTTSTHELNGLLANLRQSIPGMVEKANGVLDNTNKLTANLASIDLSGTMAKVDQTVSNIKSFTDKLNGNQGSLGLLMNDGSLYHNLNSTVNSADTLLKDLKANPKRYVHFSLFGSKKN